jgi:ATP-dependent exoDNAse (exonuclease V) beta subunit
VSNGVPSDDVQRQRAIDPTRSFVVQAPAGSGKTELLIQRYLCLLGIVDEPEEIVAITFTRKAAAEMRARVIKALREATCGAPCDSAHQQRTRELAGRALERDRARAWAVDENPGRLRIQTVDSLCASLVRQMPLLSRFGGRLEPVDDPDHLYQEAARRVLTEVEGQGAGLEALSTLLRHRDNNLGDIVTLLTGMLARREQWLRHVADPQSRTIQRDSLEAGLQTLIQEALEDVARQVPTALGTELVGLARYAAQNLAEVGSDCAILACAELERLPGTNCADLDAWLGLAELLLTKSGGWRSRCNKAVGFPARGQHKAANAVSKQHKQAYSDVLAACRDNGSLRDCLSALRNLPRPHYDPAQWEIMQALFVLLPTAAAHLEVIFQERGEVDFSGVAQGASSALGSDDAPTDLALRLDHRISHLLVDEFQDTSLSQAQLLAQLTAGWEDGDGRTLFAVGDPMQSIYGFRDAEVAVFLRARAHGIGTIRPEPLTLSTNFRSQEGIVAWVNRAFSVVFPAREDSSAGAVAYTPCETICTRLEGSAVQVHPLLNRDDARQAERIVELVQQARAEQSEGTTAILVRGKNHLVAIAPRLRAAGLRFQAVEIERLGQRPLVQDLVALTRALCHPADRLAWLAVLRAPWCGLSLHDLHALAGHDLRSTVCELMMDGACIGRMSMDGQRRLVRVREVVAASIAQRRRCPLRRRIEGAWLALGGPATGSDSSDLDNARRYFELLEQLDDGGELTDFAALQAGVEALFAAPDPGAGSGLQLMTIHKAKGLEFDTVIVPGLGRPPAIDKRSLLIWLERANRSGQVDLLMAPIPSPVEQTADSTYDAIRGLLARKTAHEDARLLYVAATRARRRLHLLGHATLNEDDTCRVATRSLLECLWPAVAQDFSALAEQSAHGAAREDVEIPRLAPRLRRFSADWRLPPPPPTVIAPTLLPVPAVSTVSSYQLEFMWAGHMARQVGIVAHRMLQRIGIEGLEHWDVARLMGLRPACMAALAALGMAREELQAGVDLVEQALLNTVSSSRGRWLFEARHSHARAEYALTGLVAGELVSVKIDRTFVDEQDVRWIIDYKTGTHEGADIKAFLEQEEARYRPQLERYAILMRSMETRPIRLGLYYPLIPGGWREWSAD